MSDFENIILQLKADSLQELDLSWNNIEDSEAIAIGQALKVNTSLQKLDLWNNNIGDSGAIAIGEALKVNTSLQDLNLWGNNIGDSGAIAFAEALKVNTSLQDLDLGYNDIGDQGAAAIADALKVNITLQELIFEDIYTDETYLKKNKLIKQNTINKTKILTFYFRKLDNIRLFRNILISMHVN